MIEIDGKIVSMELFEALFCCDLQACKGICCVEGNAGAPLEADEAQIMEEQWDNYKKYLKPEGIAAIEEQGFAVVDGDGDLTTTLIDEQECAYSIEEDGITLCAIERAWRNGECDFMKPVSCHLYPIREVQFSNGTVGLQYHRWSVCRSAEKLGRKVGKPLYQILETPIIRRYGQEFFDQLGEAYKLINAEK